MSALDGLPLLGAAGAVLSAVSGAVGAWLKGRSLTRASVAASHAREHSATEETARAQLALVPALIARITALEAHVTRLDVAVAECGVRETALVRRVTEAEARATLAEREVTLQSARADLAELDATDARRELARWRDRSDATD